MQRIITQSLLQWKNKKKRKPLVLTGVRQCGKTYVCKEFGNTYFEDTAYFNFESDTTIGSVFDIDYDVHRIITELGKIVREKEIIPGKTLVIFDEIQACPRAITSLKYFNENMPDLHIISAGSLLGIAIKDNNISFPVGKVERLQMYPMNFYEFLLANHEEALIEGLLRYGITQEIPELYTSRLEKYLKYYFIVGGMPEVVDDWIINQNLSNVEELLNGILLDYSDDFSKHAPVRDIPKLGWIWDSVPKQLAKDNNKFIFSHVKEGKRSSELEDALMWLINAGLIHKLELISTPELPLSFHADATYFKIYLCDVGLLRKKSGISPKTILTDSELYKNFKGTFTENYVMTELVSLNYKPYFWRSGNSAELDFIFENADRIIPMEAKADIHTRAKSYLQFCKKYHPVIGFKASLKNVGFNQVENTNTYSIPLYMLFRLSEYLDAEN